MADPVAVTYTFANGPGNTADGTQVNQNYADLVGYLNNRLGNLSSGQLLVANASGQVVGRSISGDIVIDNAGVASIAAGALNDDIGEEQLTAALAQKLGISEAGIVRRGKSIIPEEGTRTNVAYGALDGGAAPGPDQVAGIVLPTDGLIAVAFQGLFKSSVVDTARAAIFVGANQLKIADKSSGVPEVQEAICGAGDYQALATVGYGLAGTDSVSVMSEVTTGQVVGMGSANSAGATHSISSTVDAAGHGAAGPVYIFAAAGTYDISVQFKATSGSVTAKERKLWVWTMGF